MRTKIKKYSPREYQRKRGYRIIISKRRNVKSQPLKKAAVRADQSAKGLYQLIKFMFLLILGLALINLILVGQQTDQDNVQANAQNFKSLPLKPSELISPR